MKNLAFLKKVNETMNSKRYLVFLAIFGNFLWIYELSHFVAEYW